MPAVYEFLNKVSAAIINPLVLLLFGVAGVVFLFGVYEYVKGLDSEEALSTGVRHMIWGIIGIAIMLSAKGIVGVIKGTLNAL